VAPPSSAFNITAAAANKLAFSVQPTNTLAGASITPALSVQILDEFDNLTTSTASVTVAIGTNPGAGTLSGTTTLAATSGTVTFAGLSIDKIGTGYKLTATSGVLTVATSSPFNITLGAASKVAFTTQPGNGTGGTALTAQPIGTVQDAGGNTVTTSSAPVTVAIGTNPNSGTLAGTLTVNASSGVATFAGLSIDKIGTG
jgi:hypothetical protein